MKWVTPTAKFAFKAAAGMTLSILPQSLAFALALALPVYRPDISIEAKLIMAGTPMALGFLAGLKTLYLWPLIMAIRNPEGIEGVSGAAAMLQTPIAMKVAAMGVHGFTAGTILLGATNIPTSP